MTGILAGVLGSMAAKKDIEYVGYVAASNAGTSPNTDTTVSLTSLSLQQGDLVLVGISADGNLTNITTTGYTSIQSDGTDNPDYVLSYKFMGSTPDTSVSITAGIFAMLTVVVSVFRNVGSIGTSAEASGATLDPNPPSITTSTNRNMIVAYGFLDDDNITTLTAPTNFTSIGEASVSSFSNGSSTMAAYYFQTSAGSINPATFTTDGDDAWWAATVALRP